MTRTYKTLNIEQVATILTITGVDPEICFDESGLATFTFPLTPEVANVAISYESGIKADARKLLANRNRLFKRIRGGAR